MTAQYPKFTNYTSGTAPTGPFPNSAASDPIRFSGRTSMGMAPFLHLVSSAGMVVSFLNIQ